MKIVILTLMGRLLWGVGTYAHQPRIVFGYPQGEIIQVQNPEISQAFYGMLSGQEDRYQIVSDTGFLLYVNIVVPAQEGQRTDFIVEIIEANDLISTRLDGSQFQRTYFYEPFGGDAYLMGPTFEKQVGSGTYLINVSNPDNQGKYALAIGKIESFTFKEIINTYKIMPVLKEEFFGKLRYMAFWNRIGAFLAGVIIIVIGILRAIVRGVQYIRKK